MFSGMRDFKRKSDDFIREYGEGVVRSRLFQSGFRQAHHRVTTVADHSLNVAMASVSMGRVLERMHVRMDMQDLVLGALCHDLGILGRYQKFANSRQCCSGHPKESAAIASTMIDGYDARIDNIIRCHMFPLTPVPPTCREGVIVTLADKYCAVCERMLTFKGRRWKQRNEAFHYSA